MNYPTLTERADYYDLEQAARQGFLLPDSSALALEDALLVNEEDLVSRARVLGYYSKKRLRRERNQMMASRMRHILWFTENAPDCIFAGDTYLAIDGDLYPKHYTQVKEAWSRQMSSRPDLEQITINAAMFSSEREPSHSAKLVRALLRKSPNNLWAARLLVHLGGKDEHQANQLIVPKLSKDFDKEAWRQYANKIHLDSVVFHGDRMPPMSAATLVEVLRKYPKDLSARAELIGYYHRRWKRQNVLRVDPICLNSLTCHILWCIEHIPGSKFVGNWHGFAKIDRKIAPREHAALVEAWSNKVKEFPDDGAILVSAAAFFFDVGQIKRAERLVERFQKQKVSDEDVLFNVRYGVGNAKRRSRQDPSGTEVEDALEQVALHLQAPHEVPSFPSYDLTEWASEVDLSGAHLEGVYHWVPATSIANLENVLHPESFDIYNRAKIIGSYDQYLTYANWPGEEKKGAGSTRPQLSSHVRHMCWFIDTIPECKFIATFYLESLKKHDIYAYKEVRKKLLRQVSEQKKNTKILINVAKALSRVDERLTRRIAKTLLVLSPAWGYRMLAQLGERGPDPDIKESLKKNGFKSGAKDRALLLVAKRIDLKQCSRYGRLMPCRTIWSNERALERNPNDLVLRFELLESYDAYDQYSVHFFGHTPDVVPQLVQHNLWFIQHLPAYYLYSGGSQVNVMGPRKRDRYLGDHAVILAAVEKQLRAYPSDLEIGLALNHYFPLYYENRSIAALRKLAKHHPKNRAIKKRINSLSRFLDVR